jgi:3-isopropylmalate/(R)-2-methylmalate dehydratase small subunit
MALEQIKQVTGSAVYVPGDDIDTDQIIPARFLLCVTFDGLGAQLFYDARFNADGTSKGHPLDAPTARGARVFISGKNFGCGSSREHAPQSLSKAGFRAVIAESFAEIFFGNSTTLGIPCVSLSHQDLKALSAAVTDNPALEVSVDLEKLEVRAGDQVYPCTLKQSARDALVRGEWDPIAQLLEDKAAVEGVRAALPYTSW